MSASPLRLVPGDQLGVLIDAFLDDCELANLSPRTIEFYRDKLGRFRWWCEQAGVLPDPAQHSPNDLRQFLRYLQSEVRWDGKHSRSVRSLTPGGIDGYYRTLRRFYNWCIEQEFIDKTPLKKVQRPRLPENQPEPFTPSEIVALFGAIQERGGRFIHRDTAILSVLLDVGLRVSELCNLDTEHVNINSGEVVVVMGKGGKARTVVLGATARNRLRHYWVRDRRFDDTGPLFLTRSGTRISRNTVRMMLDKLGQMTGIMPVNPHRFRHTMATNAVLAGMDSLYLQHVLGHTSLDMTRRYVKLANADMTEAARKHSPLDYLSRE